VEIKISKYRQLKLGEIAPEIYFEGDIKLSDGVNFTCLSMMNKEFILVVFGASWCPLCQVELSIIKNTYNMFEKKGIGVLFISLDVDSHAYNYFVKDFSFPSFCDYKKWQNRAVLEYNVYATPTIYVLDRNRKVLIKARSVNQVYQWALKL
jgi:peroxiredoxin